MTQNTFLRLHFGHVQELLGRVKSGNISSGVERCPEEPVLLDFSLTVKAAT